MIAKDRPEPYEAMDEMLSANNARMREAGCELAAAAMRVVGTHDGLHRLAAAVARWSTVIANEGGRGERHRQKSIEELARDLGVLKDRPEKEPADGS